MLDEQVDWRFKSFPPGPPIALRQVGDQGWNALDDFTMPVMVLKEAALRHNLRAFRDFCADHDVSLAPHAKTSMSPQLVDMQLSAGAWGVTATTVSQARVWRRFGAKRIILASQLADPAGIRWLAAELASNPEFEAYCLVDSPATIAFLRDAMKRCRVHRRLPVLVELGFAGGRTGCRSADEAVGIAHAAARCDHLQVAGVEGFEGLIDNGELGVTLRSVDAFLRRLRQLVERFDKESLFAHASEVIVSAGGSAFPDRVVACLAGGWNLTLPVRVVLRSGCYLTHDAGHYDEVGPFGERLPKTSHLLNAIEIWGSVLSTPEPGLAILGFGKRDVSYDLGLPVPLVACHGTEQKHPLRPEQCRITHLNDQHAYLSLSGDVGLSVGDLVGCGLSHPCTAFDKWRLIPVVDDEYRVVDAVLTYF